MMEVEVVLTELAAEKWEFKLTELAAEKQEFELTELAAEKWEFELTELAAEKDLHLWPRGECLVGLFRGVSNSSEEGSLSEEWLLIRDREAALVLALFSSSCGVCKVASLQILSFIDKVD